MHMQLEPVKRDLRHRTFIGGLGVWLVLSAMVTAQVVPPLSEASGETARQISVSFRDSPLDMVLEFYANLTGRTMIRAPGVEATITLRGQTRMSEREALIAIESALAMHNVALVPMGDRFLRVVQPGAVRQEGLPILRERPEEPFAETDQILSMIINLNHVEIGEVQPIIQQLIHGYGKIQTLERTNSLLITDTASNLNRIQEVLDFVDRPVELREDIFVRRINYAEAGQVASRLNEFIQDREERTTRERVAPTPETERRAPPGVIRPPREGETRRPTATTPVEAAAELAERGVIQGRVKIVADERINTLFIISRPANFTFFDRIIDILDQPVDPEIIVQVVNLEYAVAEDVAGILNDFIGAAAGEEPRGAPRTGERTPEARAEALRDFAAGLARERRATDAAESESQVGRLSAQTRILSDTRTNSLLLMGRRSDLAVLVNIIDELDVMLGQVLIEAVIVEITLGDTVESGVGWLQRTLTAYNEESVGPRGSLTVREPVAAFGGGFTPGRTIDNLGRVAEQLRDGPSVPSGGLSYYLTFFDLNLDAIIRLAATSRDARILSTPVILTTDNTEAKIIVGESRPVVTSTSASTVGDRTVSQYQFRDIGIDLTVTPRINPQRFVVMDIQQSADNVGGFEEIDGNRVPIITKREMQAQIAVRNRATIVLGGLVSTDRTISSTKVPLLGDIPLLGRLFRTDFTEDTRTELLVLITPYVMMTPEEARAESVRLHTHSHSSQTDWHTGWSDSDFSRPLEPAPRGRRRSPDPDPPPAVDPAPPDIVIPLEEGRYERDEVEDVLRSLRGTGALRHQEPAGVIQWDVEEEPLDRDEEMSDSAEDDPPAREPHPPARLDMHAPLPLR